MQELQERPAGTVIQTEETQAGLVSRNIRIGGHRTSVRLEPEMWEALHEVAGMENCSIHQLCGAIHGARKQGLSFTGALRVFLMQYYRSVALGSPQVALVRKRISSGAGNMQQTT